MKIFYQCLYKNRLQNDPKSSKPKRRESKRLKTVGSLTSLESKETSEKVETLKPFFKCLNDLIYDEIKQMQEESESETTS